MFRGMSEQNFRDRVQSDQVKDKKAIEDWMHGSGGKVLGVIVVLLGIWTVVRMFWS